VGKGTDCKKTVRARTEGIRVRGGRLGRLEEGGLNPRTERVREGEKYGRRRESGQRVLCSKKTTLSLRKRESVSTSVFG